MKHQLFGELVQHLNHLVTVYRHLLDTVRKEKQILLKADLQSLTDNNATKEAMLHKINELEKKWMQVAESIHQNFGLKETTPRLSEIASLYEGEKQQKLLRFKTVLNLMIQRTSTLNKQNEQLAQSALSHIAGAMQSITETLNKKSPYEKKGKRAESALETSGRLVSKEA